MSDTSLKNQDALLAGHRPTPAPRVARQGEEVWRVTLEGRTIACELHDESKIGAGWDVAIRQDGELSFSRRCPDEAFARFAARGILQDHLTKGWTCARCRGERWICEQHPDREWPHEDCVGPGMPCSSSNTKEPPDRPPGYPSIARLEE